MILFADAVPTPQPPATDASPAAIPPGPWRVDPESSDVVLDADGKVVAMAFADDEATAARIAALIVSISERLT